MGLLGDMSEGAKLRLETGGTGDSGGLFKAKKESEDDLRSSPIPWTLVIRQNFKRSRKG